MNTYIYAIKNLINNKMYIGSTKSIKSRKYEHFYYLKRNQHHSYHLQQSYNKYGKDKFCFFILEECSTTNRKEREIFFINEYKTANREFGYNVYEPNGENFKCAESTIVKLKEAMFSKAKPISAYTIKGVKVGNYPSINACSRELNIYSWIICSIVSKKRKSYKGLTFLLKDEEFTYKSSLMQRDMSKFYK